MPSEVVIDGETYRIGILNAKEQFHIARRLAPVIATYAQEGGAIANLAKAVRDLSDDECNYIMRNTMKIVQRKVGDSWAQVWNLQVDLPQFADITADKLIQLIVAVVQDSLGSFTSGLVGTGNPALTTGPNAKLN